ncbi:MAG: FG-GAP-like repeat-containing protein [Acidobacteriaceae bacterium]
MQAGVQEFHMLNCRRISSAVLVLAAVVFSATSFAFTAFAQTPSFSAHSAATTTALSQYSDVIGDLNGDGYEDLITGTGSSFSVRLSNGDGTYRAPITYAIPNYSTPVLLGDFNEDGKLDLVVENCPSSNCSGYSIYFGNGDGTFQAPVKHTVSGSLMTMGAADVNHDNKTDLLVLTTTDGGNSSDLQVLFANGDGTFSNGPTTHFSYGATVLLTGDFDGDGKADVALQLGSEGGTQIEILSGDGTGNFTVTYTNGNSSQGFFEAADVNGDGISDLISTDTYYCVGCTGEVPNLIVYYGATDRKMQYASIPTTGCPTNEGGDQIAVADFNGDGIPDIAFAENNCNYGSNTTMAILAGKGNNQFGPQTSVYTTANIIQPGTYALRGNRDTKADMVFSEDNSQSVFTIVTLLNTTTGNFPTCDAPDAAVGINVCSPTPNGTASSPVNFAVGAAGDTPMQRVELWTDGKKTAQQFAGAFSHYSFLNTSVPLSAGSHRIVIFAAGTDNSLQEKVFTLNVGASSSCSAPSAPGVDICMPAGGSTVSSPVQVEASGTVAGTISHMELWVDGVKKDSAAGTALNTSISLAAGSHRFAVLALNTAGQKWENAVYATVGGGGACSAPSSPGVNICTPANGSNVSSPVQIQASAMVTGTISNTQLWVDGVKKYAAAGAVLNTSISLAAGSHRFAVLAINTAGQKWENAVYATVK